MFFSIAREPQKNFSYFYGLGPFSVSTDAGWQMHVSENYMAVYKGYADSGPLGRLLDQIAQQQEPLLFGNFCVIVYDFESQRLRIQTDRLRSFPIYIQEGSQVTNLVPLGRTAWTDSLIAFLEDFSIIETKFDVIGHIDTSTATLDHVLDQINQRLDQKISTFVKHNRLPVKVFLSGGIDTLLVYSYVKKFYRNYELVTSNTIEYDRFWLQNSGDLSRYWAYAQIHHWIKPCVLTSGAPGDEFMLRSPTTADLFLKHQGINITDLLKQQEWLHSAYFNEPKNFNIFQTQTVDTTLTQEQLHRKLCNIVVNDWQHWHLGNTLTWTPLRDLEIFKLLLRLPREHAVSQIMDSGLSRILIERNSPGLTQIISDQKNSGNAMKNLCGLLLQSS